MNAPEAHPYEFSTRARKHNHHANLVRITSPNTTVFVPLVTSLILACLDDYIRKI